jgi:hypothetical protein
VLAVTAVVQEWAGQDFAYSGHLAGEKRTSGYSAVAAVVVAAAVAAVA